MKNRSKKDYVSKLLDNREAGYVSGIYVSSASKDLCVTVSVYVKIKKL